MKVRRHSVQARLRVWGQWLQDGSVEIVRSSSPFQRIAEMQENAGARGDGIVFDVIDGVSCPPDGGMAVAVQQGRDDILRSIRCHETNEAVSMLSPQMRQIVIHTYVVPGRGDPRSMQAVADLLGIAKPTVQEAITEAHKRIAKRIYGAFEFAEDQPADESEFSELEPPDER